jgi:hypothetical protein
MSERRTWSNCWLFLHRGLLAAVAVAGLFFDPAVASGELSREQASQALATLERGWVENAGQWDKRAAFSAPGYFGTTWVTKDGELRHVASKEECEKRAPEAGEPEPAARRFRKPCPAQTWVLTERWVGGKVEGIRGEEELETKVSYFLGNDPAKHRSGLPSYRYLSLGEVWPGVEVKLKASQKTVEKLFYLGPGANLGKVRVELRGPNRLRLSQEGELVIETWLGELVLSKPVAWQEKDGQKLPVQASYRLFGKNRYGFAVQGADPTLPLVIDPILQATYLGGSGDDQAFALAIAGSGEVYVAGYTVSTNFPNTSGGAQASKGGGDDAFVARLNATLTSILQSTYLGGSGNDYAYALAIAGSGEVYVAGTTASTDFPNTTGGAQPSNGGLPDAFVARLNASLTSILQSTYLGGSWIDDAWALAIAGSGDVYVAGYTTSTDFPNTSGGAQATYGGGAYDAFVARLDSTLTNSNFQSTYLGGSGSEFGNLLAIAGSGDVYVAGDTDSTNFPHTAGGAQASYGGAFDDAFVVRLNASLTSNVQSTYLGGTGNDAANALAIAGSGDVYVAGYTDSTDFPNTGGGAQQTCSSCSSFDPDAFVARLNASLTANSQSTYLGGSGYDEAYALAIAGSGEVVVAGDTHSTNFPHTTGGAQAGYGGGTWDAFVARLNASLTSNPQSTYLGGSGDDRARALAIAGSGEVVVAGYTFSTNFPNTTGGAQATYGGGTYDAFVARLSAGLAAALVADMLANAPTVPPSLGPGGTYNLSFSCTNAGPDPATNATCSIAASAGVASAPTCNPSVPVASLAAGASITCTYTFTAPGTQGGGDTPQTDITFTVTAGAANDSNAANNTASNAGGPVPLVDALDDAVSLPANTAGATFNLASNDQVGTGSPPAGATFTLLVAGTTCTGASVNSSTGVATFNVPASGTCTVQYELCYNQACDTATLTVTAQQVEPIPTLDRWGLLALLACLATAGVLLLRRVVA